MEQHTPWNKCDTWNMALEDNFSAFEFQEEYCSEKQDQFSNVCVAWNKLECVFVKPPKGSPLPPQTASLPIGQPEPDGSGRVVF